MPDTAAVREKLVQDLAVLARRHDKIDAHLHNADRELPSDWQEKANVVGNDEVLEAIDDTTRARIMQLKAAIERIDAGDWGTCTDCGGEIPEGRLVALPAATMCTSCAQAHE